MTSELRHNSEMFVLSVGVVNLNSVAAQRLHRDALPMLQAGEGIVLDMIGVEFADTSGLGVLCTLLRACSEGGTIALARCSPRLETIFARLPEGRLPKRYPTIDEAVARSSRPITDLFVETTPATVAFPIRQPASPPDDRWTNESSHLHGHVD